MPTQTAPSVTRHFMVMWSIPETFGGMTSMCLRRARNFVTLLGMPTPILCFQLIPDTRELTQVLAEKGHLVPGMEIWNVFAHYRAAALQADPDRVVDPPPANAKPPEGPSLTTDMQHDDEGRLFARITKTNDNVIVYRECLRPDGSRYLLDVSDLDDAGRPRGRNLWLIAPSGAAVERFTSATGFYHHWLDEITGGEPSALMFDDKVAARILRGYAPSHVVKLTVVHSNHVASGRDAMRGPLDPNRELILTNQQDWDGVVFLTDAARDDYESRFGATRNHFVVPNPSTQPGDEVPAERAPHRGVMIAQLRPAKNVVAAVRAVGLAKRRVPDVHLDVYGEGITRPKVEAEIAARGLGRNVTLHGHVSGAAGEFASASFSLMTSRYEGWALSIVESMARSCPPIAFDFKYGPRSIITDGVDGHVVPTADVRAMADRIVKQCLDATLVERLGTAARRRSLDFTDEAVTEQWLDVIERAWQRRARLRIPLTAARVELSHVTAHTDGTIALDGLIRWTEKRPHRAHESMTLRLQALPRKAGDPIDLPVRVIRRSGQALRFSAQIGQTALAAHAQHPVLDIFLIAVSEDAWARVVLPAPAPSITPSRFAPGCSADSTLVLTAVLGMPTPMVAGSAPSSRGRLGHLLRRLGRMLRRPGT